MNGGVFGKRRFIVIIIALVLWAITEGTTTIAGYGGLSTNAQVALGWILTAYFGGDAVKKFAKAPPKTEGS